VLAPLSLFGNATFVRSRVTIDQAGGSALTNADRPMVGQSPYVVNAGLTFSAADGRWTATLLYNVTGRRIAEAGTGGIPDAYEAARQTLDVSLRAPLFARLGLKVDGQNLLDTPVLIRQGAVTRLRYTTGRGFTVGVHWQP